MNGEFRCITADWPMGSHEVAMPEDVDLSPPAMADLIADFIEKLGLEDVVLVANDSGGAISQLIVTRRPERIGALVLTPCDAFEKFPPAPFDLLPKIAAHKRLGDVIYQGMRLPFARFASYRPLMKHGYDSKIVKSWITPGLRDAGVRRDGQKFAAGMDNKYTLGAVPKLREFDKPAMIAWSPECTFFKYEMAERLADVLPQSRLEPVPGGLTFLSEDQPVRLAELITEFAHA
jgi:pimeloyl-ACP methyl ester carboxylesterase